MHMKYNLNNIKSVKLVTSKKVKLNVVFKSMRVLIATIQTPSHNQVYLTLHAVTKVLHLCV